MTTPDKPTTSEDPRVDSVRSEVQGTLDQSPQDALKAHYVQAFEKEAENLDSFAGKIKMILEFMVANKDSEAVKQFGIQYKGFNTVLNDCEREGVANALVMIWLPHSNEEDKLFSKFLDGIYTKINRHPALFALIQDLKAKAAEEDNKEEKGEDEEEINKDDQEKNVAEEVDVNDISDAEDYEKGEKLENPKGFQTIKIPIKPEEMNETQVKKVIVALEKKLAKLGDEEDEKAKKVFADLFLAKSLLK